MFKDFMNNDCGGGNNINKFTNQIFENRIGSQQQENWHEELQNFNMEKPLGQFGEVYNNNNNQIMRFDNQRERMFELGGQNMHPGEKMNQFYFSEDEMLREYQQFRPKQRHQMRSNNMQMRKMNEREEWSEDYHQMEGNQWTNEYHKPQQDWHEEYNNDWTTEYQSNLNELDDEYERVYNKQDGDKDWTSEYEDYNMEKAFEDNQTEKQERAISRQHERAAAKKMSDKPFVPPIFKKFGKSVSDFLKQKFSYERQIKIRTATANGIRVTTTGTASKSGDYAGAVEGQYKHSSVGLFKAELKTSGSTEATVEADKLVKGALFRVVVSDAPKYQADVEYSQDFVSGTVNLDSQKGNTILGASAAVGFDGISVGGEAKFDAKKSEVSDFNAGFEYSQTDFTGTVKTREKADAVDVMWFQTVNPDLSVGGKADYKFTSREWGVTGLVGYKFDDRTNIKATGNNKGILAAVLEQQLASPSVLVRFAAEYDATKYSTVPDKFGLSLFFGEGYSDKD